MKAVQYVINIASSRLKKEGRRSVLAIPLVGGTRSYSLNAIVEKAVKENITVVTSAGKQLIASFHCVSLCTCVVCLCIPVYKCMFMYCIA